MDRAVCHFVFYTGPRKGEAQAFDTARVSIGRASGCDFRLEAFQLEQVSNQHAEVLLEEGDIYCLYDLGSKTGTWVNGERVQERCCLMHEDYVRFGKEGPEVIFRIGQPVAGTQPLPQIFPVTAELEFFSGSDAGRIFPVNAGVVSNIGRRADLEVPLDPRGDMIVSGNHCNIRFVNGHFVLTDSSRNGTYVNSELLEQPMEVIEGDVIMLGDGGPQARFHVDSAKRHYPNHRPLSPVIKREKPAPAPSVSALSAGTAAGAVGPFSSIPMQSAKPYSTGTPISAVTPSAGQDSLSGGVNNADGSSVVGGDQSATVAGDTNGDYVAGNADAGKETEATLANAPAGGAPKVNPAKSKRRFTMPSVVPLTHGLQFKPGRKVIFGAIAIVVLIGLIMVFTSGDETSPDSSAARGDYAEALEELVPLKNIPGTFSVQVPKGWTTRNNDNIISTESVDKEVAVDYVRDASLTEAGVSAMLSRNGATLAAKTEEKTVDGVKVKTRRSSVGNLRRIAALHQPKTGAPALAFLETTEQSLSKLDEDSLDLLLVENLTAPATAKAPATPAAAPRKTTAVPVAAPNAQLPKPAAVTPTPQASPTVAAAAPEPTATPGAETVVDGLDGGTSVTSKALKLAMNVPKGWTAESEESDAMILFSDGAGVEIRLARDPGDLKADVTFKAMTDEGWTSEGTQPGKGYQAGEFSREGQNLLLVLIPEKKGTTIVIYATSSKDFTDPQRKGISYILKQLLP